MTGGGQPIPAGLSYPPSRFLTSDWLWILLLLLTALTTINKYPNMFHKIQILPASIQNPFLEIHPFTGLGGGGGGGGRHNPAGLPYPPPKILEL